MTNPNPTLPNSGPPAAYRAPTRPPLGRREKRGAFWAGAVGFNLLTLGFALVIIPIVVGLFGAFFGAVIESIARSSDELSTGFLTMLSVVRSIDFGLVTIIALAVAVVGLAIMTGAIFLSRGILRSHGVNRAWPVTWAGAGIAIGATWIIGWVPSVSTQFAFGALDSMGLDSLNAAIIVGIVGAIVGIAFTGVIGWLSWWWMAHAYRSASRVDAATEAVQE